MDVVLDRFHSRTYELRHSSLHRLGPFGRVSLNEDRFAEGGSLFLDLTRVGEE